MNRRKIAQDFEDFAKVVKFRQIWSHWSQMLVDESHLTNLTNKVSLHRYSLGILLRYDYTLSKNLKYIYFISLQF